MDFSDLPELYKNRFSEAENRRKNAIWVEVVRFIQQFVNPTDILVDVACGSGEFVNNIKAAEKIAVDMNPESAAKLSKEIAFYNIPADQIGSSLPIRVDVVFTSNFLEHLPDKNALDFFLEQIHAVLKPGGRFIVMGPNLRYLHGAYWDFYDHTLGLTHLSLIEALQIKGFAIKKCYDRFLPYTTKTSLPTHPLLVRLYLSIPWFWRFMGKQFFLIATKNP